MATSAPGDGIDSWLVSLPLSGGFANAVNSIAMRHTIVVRIRRDDLSGWGEAAPYPGHSAETVDEIWRLLKSVNEAGELARAIGGSQLLKAATDQARSDLDARSAGAPLWRYLGGSNEVVPSAAIGVDDSGQPDRSQVARALAAGYTHLKLKLTPQSRPDEIGALITAHPQAIFGADGNGSLGEDAEVLMALDRIGLAFLEQPLPASDLAGSARLVARLMTPIALDESVATSGDVTEAIARESGAIITLKVGRFGPQETLRLAAAVTGAGLQARLGGLVETGVGRAHSVALSANPLFAPGGDVAGSDMYFTDDLVRPQWRVDRGRIALPTAPGIGVAVDETALRRHALDSHSVD